LTEGCPAEFDFKEDHDNKMLFLERGNEPSVEQNQAVVQKTLNEEERNNHIIPFFGWLVFVLCMCTLYATVNAGQTWEY